MWVSKTKWNELIEANRVLWDRVGDMNESVKETNKLIKKMDESVQASAQESGKWETKFLQLVDRSIQTNLIDHGFGKEAVGLNAKLALPLPEVVQEEEADEWDGLDQADI